MPLINAVLLLPLHIFNMQIELRANLLHPPFFLDPDVLRQIRIQENADPILTQAFPNKLQAISQRSLIRIVNPQLQLRSLLNQPFVFGRDPGRVKHDQIELLRPVLGQLLAYWLLRRY